MALGPNVAGSWYPADPELLAAEVDRLLDGARERARGFRASDPARAVIVPHAGYRYSGPVAASGFWHLQGGGARRVILLGPSHYVPFAGAALPATEGFCTPLGEVALDRAARDRLSGLGCFHVSDAPFRREHSLEAEVPFLQRCLSDGWLLLPILLGDVGTGRAREIADGLAPLWDEATLAVVSSDFTHHGPRFGYAPFDHDVLDEVERLDRGAIERILECDADGFAAYVARTGATICGRSAIEVLLRLPLDRHHVTLESYDTSGRITGDLDHSVSYASLTVRDTEPRG